MELRTDKEHSDVCPLRFLVFAIVVRLSAQALLVRWRSPCCQNMPFSFLRLDGRLFSSFSQFSRCLLSLNNNSSAIVDSTNQKWFHQERFYLSGTRLTASIFSVHHNDFSLPLQLETAFHNSGRCLWKGSLAFEVKTTPQLLLFLDAVIHLHFKKSELT